MKVKMIITSKTKGVTSISSISRTGEQEELREWREVYERHFQKGDIEELQVEEIYIKD